ncbi:MAG: hypothetical protein FJY85_15635, partial [Deltaproteobacteria bacterium]|nr:hypothetical protein [Deltaproteobacteria bacterium]
YLRKYAAAVESKLYIDMRVEQAHNEIDTAEKLASTVYNEAAALEAAQIDPDKSEV